MQQPMSPPAGHREVWPPHLSEAAETGRLFQCDACGGPVAYAANEDPANLVRMEQHVCSARCYEKLNGD